MRVLTTVTHWVFILSIPPLLLTATIGWAVNSHWLYNSGFQKYNVSRTTTLEPAELAKVATGLINYFNSAEEYLSLTVIKDDQPLQLFTWEEIIHLKDVKGLIRLNYLVLLGTVIYSLLYTRVSLFWHKHQHRRRLAWGTLAGSGVTLALMLALGLGTLLNFNRLFLQFHLISFTNEFWSAEGYMRLLFPQDFWYDAVMLCAGIISVLAVILGGIAGAYLLATRKARA